MKAINLPLARRLILALTVAALAACSWLAPLEPSANRYVDAGLKRALVSYASARALNALISVAQGTELAVQPAGVGVIFSPGRALTPINDLVEQFADLMLTASVAFGAQKVLLTVGAHWIASLALSIVALAWTALYLRRGKTPNGFSRLLLILLMVRFALPLAVIASNALFERFMATDYQTSQQGIESVSGRLDSLAPTSTLATGEAGLLERLKTWAMQHGDLKARYAEIKRTAEQATERIVKLMVVFLLQTLVFPVALLWMLWGLARRVFEAPAAFQGEREGPARA